jgi:hypothetical protein
MSKEMREQIDRVKNWKQFLNENEMNFLPLNSLEWEFWNQSGAKIHKNSEIEFKKHVDLFMNNILNISKNENISLEDLISHLKKFWDESIREEYVDMRVNRNRFMDFKTNVGR